MKHKNNLTCFVLLLFFFLFINFSIASRDYNDYIKIQEGDEFTWRIGVDMLNYQKLVADTNQIFIDDIDIEGVKIIVNDIEKIPDLYDSSYSEVEFEVSFFQTTEYSGGEWTKSESIESISIYTYREDYNQDLEPTLYLNSIYYGPYFIPADLDWDSFIYYLEQNYFFGYAYPYSEVNINAVVNGKGITLTLDYPTLEIFTLTIKYTMTGVLESYLIKYGGDFCIVKELQGILPIFASPIIVGIVVLSVVGIIKIINRKG